MAPDPTRAAAPSSTSPVALQRWMRTVGGFYLLMGVFNPPPIIAARFPVQTGDRSAPGDHEPPEVDHAAR